MIKSNKMIISSKKSLSIIVLALCVLLLPSLARATPLSVALDIQGQGLSIAKGGVGLEGIGAGSRNITVNIGGPVQAALLYWTGRDRPCPQSGGACVVPSQPYKDQVLKFENALITGTIIGTEGQPVTPDGPINNIGYLADVTSLVQAKGTGLQTFAVMDGDAASNLFRLNGAGLIVIYTNPTDTAGYRLIVFHGLDFAYGADSTPGPTQVTQPVVFNHLSVLGNRQATLYTFVGDGEANRPDRIDISNNPSVVNGLDGSDGASWDTDSVVVNIPSGVGSTTVQLFSEPVNQNPDDLLWQVAALRLPLVPTPPPWTATGNSGVTEDEGNPAKLTYTNFTAAANSGSPAGTYRLRYNITAIGNLTSVSAANTRLRVRFRDDGAGSRVTVAIVRSPSTGGATTLGTVFDSDNYPPGSGFQTQEIVMPAIAFDFTQNTYWLEVTLTKADTANQPGFGSAQIDQQ